MNDTDDNYQPCTKEFALANPDVSQARFCSQLECAWGDWIITGALAYVRDPSQYEFRTLKRVVADPVFEASPDATVSISVGRVHPKTLRDRVTDRIREVCPSPHEATDKDWVFALIDVLDTENRVFVMPEGAKVKYFDLSRPIGEDRGIE